MTDQAHPNRGRDFTGYRIGGGVAALLLVIALGWQIFEIIDGDAMTVPETQWQVSDAPEGDAGQMSATEVLIARTQLMDERFQAGPSPEAEALKFAIGPGPHLDERPLEDGGRNIAEDWLLADAETLEMVRPSERVVGTSSLPYPNAEIFERPGGRDWRLGMADTVTHLGAVIILGFSLLLAMMLALRGRVPIAKGRSGRTVKRFGFLERANHWMTATSFIVLGLTGIVIAYGDTLIRPFGADLLGALGNVATWGHALFFPPFALGVLIMILLWTWRNLPAKEDARWLAKAGGFFSDDGNNPPAKKFNAGQKLVFWSAALGGIAMILTGVTLMFPYFWADLEVMTWVMLVHAVLATVLIGIFIGHIYIGTVGMQGAIWAMWNGKVDRNWAEEHHEFWVKELHERGELKQGG
ncbi:hypothetical protein A3731_03245 [Roseovarius sp. HI0049]|nr:hypothetical protein A3731_03245 [Roseovarius sp. HI0049]